MITVAFQGELGAFSEEAVHRFFSDGADPRPRRGFAEVGQAVTSGEVEYGLLPIENSLAGSVVGSYDVLSGGELAVVGEVVTPIHHCLLGLPGAEIGTVTHVLSHPVALAQCQRFLQAHPAIEPVVFYDTAGAAREVSAGDDRPRAAIAGRSAAARYGLTILAENIEDRQENQTRFLAVARPDSVSSLRRSGSVMKPALRGDAGNSPGALGRLLVPFADRGINLSKIESRPGTEPWTYRFFIEVEADATSQEAIEALTEARPYAARLQFLGSYP